MQCPIDNETLVMTERNGVEIDYCPKCRGVWLDRGELDKIVERAGSGGGQAAPRQADARQADTYYDDRRHKDDRYEKPRKRESFLSELFDF